MASVLASVLASSSCTYSPNLAEGVLGCGVDDSCPKGYSCASDGTCRKHALSGADAGDPGSRFVGTWTFQGGTFDATCSDGSSNHDPPAGDFIVVTRSGADVLAQYFCDTGWTLTVAGNGTTATAAGGQTCVRMATDQASGVVTTFTWSAVAFSFGTMDAASAVVSGHLTGRFSATDRTSGTCDLTFQGSLTKTGP